MKILETERLLLRPADELDAPFIARLMNDPFYLEYVGDRHVRTAADAHDYLSTAPIYDYSDGLGFNIVIRTDTLEAIGICGLVKRAGYDAVDVGYALLEEFAGAGFATEATRATVEHAFEDLGLPELLGITTLRNVPSRRVLEKVGMSLKDADEESGRCVYRLCRPSGGSDCQMTEFRDEDA